jgi:hypothetical protein
MKSHVAAFASGSLFGIGLLVSGMTKPAKVIGFLDLFGAWDASLMFVMMGAIGVHLVAYRLILKRGAPLFDAKFHLPARKDIDARLVVGAALFGVGWGLGGYCPGPALVSLGSGALSAFVFVGAMTLGMLLERAVTSKSEGAPSSSSAGAPETPAAS